MSVRSGIVIATLWLVSLLAVGISARGQAFGFQRLDEPIMISGSDIAFRVEGWKGNAPAGTWVIRMDGRWLEPQSAPAVPIPLSSR